MVDDTTLILIGLQLLHFQADRLKQELHQNQEHVQLLTSNYQTLVAALRERDNIIQKEFDRHNVRLGRHHSDIEGLSSLVIVICAELTKRTFRLP